MKEMTVEGEHEISMKRLYLPIEIETKCPECEGSNKKDFEDEYLSYPVTNTKEAIYMCCDHCDMEYEFDVILNLSLSVDENMRRI